MVDLVWIPDTGKLFFSPPKLPELLWSPTSLLFISYRGLFNWGKEAGM
jgi:hypothetical protein